MSSVLQEWVMKLPLREQGALLTCVRGCDLTPKYPLDSPARNLTASIRGAFMVPADVREVNSEPGCFMMGPFAPPSFKISAFDSLPNHWVMHVMHGVEILGYRHPLAGVRDTWLDLYYRFCHALHVNPESFDQMRDRLSEDRIANKSVVS